MVANLLERPPHFERSVAINLRGAAFLSDRPKIPRLQFPEFKVLVQEGATILDVRPAALFADAHAVAGEFSRDTPLALLRASGYRSSIATSLLESEGFTRVSNVMGGMDAIDLNCGDDLLWPRARFLRSFAAIQDNCQMDRCVEALWRCFAKLEESVLDRSAALPERRNINKKKDRKLMSKLGSVSASRAFIATKLILISQTGRTQLS
jgi:rhodanese-related sulfurtransferase